jgi:peptide/nickel transport system ATP-binding protein
VALLEVKDLHVSFRTDDGIVQAVRGVSFKVDAGQTLGIVGESGSGKSVATQTIMGLTRGAEVQGQALFEGRDMLTMTRADMMRIRGAQIGMIFQDPLSSLHPFYTVGWQIIEMIRLHEKSISKAAARRRAIELLQLVGIPQPDRRVDDYPHQFSGGMRQRAMIAMAMALNPALLIADEPTTALDVTVQAQVLQMISRLQEEFGTAVLTPRDCSCRYLHTAGSGSGSARSPASRPARSCRRPAARSRPAAPMSWIGAGPRCRHSPSPETRPGTCPRAGCRATPLAKNCAAMSSVNR